MCEVCKSFREIKAKPVQLELPFPEPKPQPVQTDADQEDLTAADVWAIP